MQTLKLIALYYYICDEYTEKLRWVCQRFSRNEQFSGISDEELLTIYLYCTMYQEKYRIKSMHTYVKDHLQDWFPQLPSYATFNHRLNRLVACFHLLASELCQCNQIGSDVPEVLLVDSMPIITCTGNRKGKVAPKLTAKGYCSTKKLHYYGVKLHAMALKVPKTLPCPKLTLFSPADVHDLSALRPHLEQLNVPAVLDKAYCDADLAEEVNKRGGCLLTPEKQKKGEGQAIRQYETAYRQLLGTAIAKIRQPIESLFAWIQEKTNIQAASKVRSEKGLLLHLFAKMTAALLLLHGF